MQKLTLTVDEQVVKRAKSFAEAHGTSVSRIVERYLDLVSRPKEQSELPPVLKRLKGSLKDVKIADHYAHLERKYK